MSNAAEPTIGPSEAQAELRDLATGLLGAAALLPVELMALGGSSPHVSWVATALLAGLGLVIGATVAVQEATIRWLQPGPWKCAGVRALGTLLVLVPVSRHLFDGAFASTLPGAAWGFVWVPALGFMAAAIVLRATRRWVASVRGARAIAIVLAALAVLTEAVNRTAYRSEYPDIHTLLLVVAIVCAGLALRLLAPKRLGSTLAARSAARLRTAVALTILAGFVTTLGLGLREDTSRWALAERGLHARLLVRTVRAGIDLDGDGHAALLGGGDCNDSDPGIHPGAKEIVGNEIDENCDGLAAAELAPAVQEEEADRRSRLERWRNSDRVISCLTRARHMNLLLIGAGALRADMLVPTQANLEAFPNMFALLDGSRTFSLAFSPSAGTDLSMASILTGRIDPFSGVEQTLAEALDETGRDGYAVIPSEVLRYVGRAILVRGLDGFRRLINDRFEQDVGSYTTSHRTTQLGLAFLDRRAEIEATEPFFLWLHYFDIHEHDEIDRRDRHLREVTSGERPKGTEARYRAVVGLVDRQVGELVQALHDRDLWDRTIVVFFSDHGESLGEDPRLPDNHGKYVYNPLVHVPFAIRIPGEAGRTIPDPVSLLDMYPTLLELHGAQVSEDVDGVSLLPHLVDGAPADLLPAPRPIALNESDQYGVVLWPRKLMVRPQENLTELYDLEQDFAEQDDLSSAEPDLVLDLARAYDSLPKVMLDRTPRGRWLRERATRKAAPSP
jgi:arylsulfatase A-like enzyme